jgi:CrcB protein
MPNMVQTFLGQLLLVGCGGFIGSSLRYALGGFVQRQFPGSDFPFGTIAVNLLGCLVFGYLAGAAEQRQLLDAGMRLFLLVGILGGFTTFSTFSYENVVLLQDAEYFKMLANVVIQVVIGFSAAWAGLAAARMI